MPAKKGKTKLKINATIWNSLTILIVILVVGIILSFHLLQNVHQSLHPVATITPTSPLTRMTSQPFFLTSVPKPISMITRNDLPNDQVLIKPTLYNHHLFFIGSNGATDTGPKPLIEYDLTAKIIDKYSDPTYGPCSDFVITKNFLFVSCKSSIYKVDLSNYSLVQVFDHIGIPNPYGENFTTQLHAVNNSVLFGTANGFGVINQQTNAMKYFLHEDKDVTGNYMLEESFYADARQMFQDGNYIWIYADVGSFHGLILINTANFWQKGEQKYTYLPLPVQSGSTQIAAIPIANGIQVSIQTFATKSCIEQRYNYLTKQWIQIDSQSNATAQALCSAQSYNLLNNFFKGTQQSYISDASNLTQAIVIDSTLGKQEYEINGRSYYMLSPVINGKRYILTSSGIDVLDETLTFPNILITLGAIAYTGEIQNPNPRSTLLIDSPAMLGLVITSSPPNYQDSYGHPFLGETKIWIVDLNSGKLLKQYSYSNTDSIQMALNNISDISTLTLSRTDNKLHINSLSNATLFTISLTDYSLSLLQ